MFFDRFDAGKKLADELILHSFVRPVVLAIPRGGVIIGIVVMKRLSCEFDLIIPRKIGAPGNPELAIGAVISKDEVEINENLKKNLNVSEDYIKSSIEEELKEITRRRKKYLGDREPVELVKKTAIIVDDGLATGYTALAAVKAIKKRKPEKVVLAVPVGPRDTIDYLRKEADEVIFLHSPRIFYAVGQFYKSFTQVSDEVVIEKIKEIIEDKKIIK
ncbi:MAG: phosphoribosyltransferase [Actinomycetia bacterium]|nr:phosphoribosyltransferase [Actinomycetes bacterium]